MATWLEDRYETKLVGPEVLAVCVSHEVDIKVRELQKKLRNFEVVSVSLASGKEIGMGTENQWFGLIAYKHTIAVSD